MPLHILLLEDSDDDADLILRELRKEELEFAVQRVETESDYRRQLLEFAPDLILADYSLPHYDGMSALAVARAICPAAPFIFVSGTMGEETAIEAFHHGATDYVLKQRLSRLGPAVRRALLEVEECRQREQAEKDRHEAEHRFRVLFEQSPDGIVILEPETARIIEFNEAAYRQLGYSRDEFAQLSIPNIEAAETLADTRMRIEGVCRKGRDNFDTRQRTKQGEIRDVHVTAQIIEVAGQPVYHCTWRDITERKQMQERLELQSAALAAAASSIVITDGAGIIEWINPAFSALTGYTAAEAIGKTPGQLVKSGRHDATFYRNLWETILAGQVWRGEIINRRKDGSFYTEEETISSLRNEGGEITHFIGIKLDVTLSRQAEKILHETQANLARAESFSHIMVVHLALDGRWLKVPPLLCQLLGFTEAELLAGRMQDRLHPDDAEADWHQCQRLLQGDLKTFTSDKRFRNKDGQSLWFETNVTLVLNAQGEPERLLVYLRDITEKKQLEAQSLRSQRLESVGRLASGIAHDLNNILAPILMGVPMLREEMTSEGNQRLLNTMESCAQRGASIVKQVLAFGRGIEGQKMPLQPRHLLWEMAQIIRETFPKSITLRVLCPNDLWTVSGNATQLHQVLMNLCVNARDAMPAGGALTLAAGNVQLDDTFAGKVERLQPGPYVLLTVTDTGTGISPENLDRIFEPFFTTKPIDLGTGLGLSTVFGIVKSHGGAVLVASTLGQGTQFSIYLPATDAMLLQPSSLEPEESLKGNGELILVVDDEESIRAMTVRGLQAHGYRTLAARDGAEAMALYDRHRTDIQLVVTDLMMPIMDGTALIRALRKMSPELKIMVTSGLGSHPLSNEAVALGVSAFLLKPYDTTSLLNSLQDVLHHPGASCEVPTHEPKNGSSTTEARRHNR